MGPCEGLVIRPCELYQLGEDGRCSLWPPKATDRPTDGPTKVPSDGPIDGPSEWLTEWLLSGMDLISVDKGL